jgi:hypothetical protein
MSAFKVYGISRDRITKNIQKNTHIEDMGVGDWVKLTTTKAGEIYDKTTKKVALSAAFDAPQFALDFIDLCKSDDFKSLEIRYYKKTGKQIAKGKRKGMDAYAWTRYSTSSSIC